MTSGSLLGGLGPATINQLSGFVHRTVSGFPFDISEVEGQRRTAVPKPSEFKGPFYRD